MEINTPLESKVSAIQQNNKDCLEKRAGGLGTANEQMQKNNCGEIMQLNWTGESICLPLCCHGLVSKRGMCDVKTLGVKVARWEHGGETQGTTGEKQVGVHPGSGVTISHSVSCLWAEHGANYQDKQNKSCCSCQTAQPVGFNLVEYNICYSIFSWCSKGHSVSQSTHNHVSHLPSHTTILN